MKTVLWDRTLFLRPLVFILLPDLVLWQLQQLNKTTKNNNLLVPSYKRKEWYR